MRRLILVVAVVFLLSILTAAVGGAATSPTKQKSRTQIVAKQKSTKYICKPKRAKAKTRVRAKAKARAARAARGPRIACPAPVVNVPQQPAPVVNVPQQPAPVVNVPAPPPTVGVTTDNNYIYIVRENQLMIIDKCNYECKKTVTLQ